MSSATITLQTNPFGPAAVQRGRGISVLGRESQVDAMVNKLAATHFWLSAPRAAANPRWSTAGCARLCTGA